MRTVWIYSLQISDTGRVYRDIPPSEAEVVDEFGGIPRIVKILNSGKIIKNYPLHYQFFNTPSECIEHRNKYIEGKLKFFEDQWKATERNLKKRIIK